MPLPTKYLIYMYFDTKITILKELYERKLKLILYNNKHITYDDISKLLIIKYEIESLEIIYKELNELL